MIKKIMTKIKGFLIDLDYEQWNIRIMSDAMEYHENPKIVDKQLEANYINHLEMKQALVR